MGNVYEIATSLHDGQGNFMQNVFHYFLDESGTGTPFTYARNLVASWASTIEAKYVKLFGNDVVLDFYSAKKVTGGGGPSFTEQRGTNGTGVSNSMSSAFAADVAWISAAASNKPGHTFLGGMSDGAIGAGAWQAPFTTDCSTWITQMLSTITLGGALGSATFCHFTRKTLAHDVNTDGFLRPKPTGMNKRTLPLI